MSNFFSCIVTRNAGILFCELDAHDEIVNRSGLSDDLVHFLRVVYDHEGGYLVDSATIPEWYERRAALIERKVVNIYKRLFPIWKEYDKLCQAADARFAATVDGAWSRFVGYRDSRQVGGVVSQSDEDDEIIQLRFDEFVDVEKGARIVLRDDVCAGLERYKMMVSSIRGYLEEAEREDSDGS